MALRTIQPNRSGRLGGELFIASSNDLVYLFDYRGHPAKYARYGKTVQIVGLNASSSERHERLAGKLGAGH